MSGEEEEEETGCELGQAYVSEIERALGDRVDLPAYGYGLHLQRDDDQEARERVGDEVGMGEGDPPGQAGVLGSEHSLLLCHRIINQHRSRHSCGDTGLWPVYGAEPRHHTDTSAAVDQ